MNYSDVAAPIIFIVVPCYNEESVLSKTASVLKGKIFTLIQRRLISGQSRILFVDDGSNDATWQMITEFHIENPQTFGGIKLSHNEGHQNALMAGLMSSYSANCDAAISMDADLQDDINVIDRFIENFISGDEIVYGVRSSREKDTWFKRNSANAFYKLFRMLGAESIPNHADYRLMGKKALHALSEYPEVNLFLRGIVPTLGFKSSKVFYERGVREAGESKYPLKKMLAFALQGITAFSTRPLRFVTVAGISSILVGLIMFVYTLVSFFSGSAVTGWGSMMCSMWLIGGLIMASLGVVGAYIGKIYAEVKQRPRYIIEESL